MSFITRASRTFSPLKQAMPRHYLVSNSSKNVASLIPNSISPGVRRNSEKAGPEIIDYSAEVSFWKELYSQRQDVFTLDEPNPNLLEFWDLIVPEVRRPTPGAKEGEELPTSILVPGCGRDQSMSYITSQGCLSFGVDYCPTAIAAYGRSIGGHQLLGNFSYGTLYSGLHDPLLMLLHADLSKVGPDEYGIQYDAVFDRACLTAVREEKREIYLRNVIKSLKLGGKILMEYLACNIDIPGSLSRGDAERLLEYLGMDVEELKVSDVRHDYPNFNPPNLKYLDEHVILATKTKRTIERMKELDLEDSQ